MSFKKIQRFIYIQVLGFGFFFVLFLFFFKVSDKFVFTKFIETPKFWKMSIKQKYKNEFFSLESDFVDLKIYYKQCILSIFKNSNYLIWIVN